MIATLHLLLARELGSVALTADVVLTAAAATAAGIVALRRRRTRAVAVPDIVAEAEAVVTEAPGRQPA